jgi:hypothetical protein
MSFRKYGGMSYAATHNIVKSNVNTTDSFYVTNNVGQSNSYINFDSDISGNLNVSGSIDINNLSGPTIDNFPLTMQGPSDQSNNSISSLNIGFNMGAGAYNSITDSSDNIIWWTDNNSYNISSGLVIAPWYNSSTGIRISNDGLTVNVPNGNQALTAGYALYVDGSANISGQLYVNGTNITSDYRIKENVTTLDKLFTVDNLNPVTYKNTKTDKQDVGFIAHELQEHYPFLVNGTKDGYPLQSVNYIGLIGILTKEIQCLKKELSFMKQQIVQLQNK